MCNIGAFDYNICWCFSFVSIHILFFFLWFTRRNKFFFYIHCLLLAGIKDKVGDKQNNLLHWICFSRLVYFRMDTNTKNNFTTICVQYFFNVYANKLATFECDGRNMDLCSLFSIFPSFYYFCCILFFGSLQLW